MPQATLRERFERRIRRSDGCWLWAGSHQQAGYAVVAVKDEDGRWRPALVHRIAYEFHVGPIPEGLQLDHLCRNRACSNPAHLEPVTPQTNFCRSEHASAIAVRTGFCKHGHPFDADNTVHRANGTRECRACIKRRNDLRPRKGAVAH